MKICKKCGVSREETEYYFHSPSQKFELSCKQCRREIALNRSRAPKVENKKAEIKNNNLDFLRDNLINLDAFVAQPKDEQVIHCLVLITRFQLQLDAIKDQVNNLEQTKQNRRF